MESPGSAIIMTLPQVIDAALGKPEYGFISYGLLNSVLHVMCQQLNLEEVQVQYQGTQAHLLQKVYDTSTTKPVRDENISVVTDKYPTSQVFAISQTQLDIMEKEIKHLKDELADLRGLPSNTDLFLAVKSRTGDPTPLADMYQILSITKRLDATEHAIMKIASFVEDLTRYVQGDEQPFKEFHETYNNENVDMQRADSLRSDLLKKEEKFDQGAKGDVFPFAAPTAPAARVLPAPLDISFPPKVSTLSVMDSQDKQKIAAEEPTNISKIILRRENSQQQSSLFELPKSKMDEVEICDMPNREAFQLLQTELTNLRRTTDDLVHRINMTDEIKDEGKTEQVPTRSTTDLEKKIGRCVAQINAMDSAFTMSYTGITNRLADIEESIKLVFDKAINEVEKADFEEQLSQSVFSLNEKVKALETLAAKISDTLANMLDDFGSDQSKLMTLLEDMELVKSDKVGRQEFGEALSEKVDLCMVNRKVSHDQFNATCDDLSKGIEEALEKLMEQEELWHVALKEIQEEISGKLCREDLLPLEGFVSEKLKALQLKMKTLAKLKGEQEAAATKRKYLRDVQCISCDKDVIMRKNLDTNLHFTAAPTLPAHKNIAPYLAYELDQLRRQQHQMQYGKNLHHFEAVMQESKSGINRYCGGSHTITTPQQRVTRPGNFIEQWDLKAMQAEELSNLRKPVHISTCIQKKPSKLSLTVKSAVKPVQAEKDEDKETKNSDSEETTNPEA